MKIRRVKLMEVGRRREEKVQKRKRHRTSEEKRMGAVQRHEDRSSEGGTC